MFSSSCRKCVHVFRASKFLQHCVGVQGFKTAVPKWSHDTSDGVEENGAFNDGREEDEATSEETQLKILSAALRFVREYGWTKKALIAGVESENMPPTAHGMFPRGGGDLALYYIETCNKQLVQYLQKQTEETQKVKTTLLIRGAVEHRFRMLIPYIEQWPQAMAILTLPRNAPDALKSLTTLMDDIWYYAGDRSVDFNWYTKRVSLAALYKSTELYMVQDRSEDFHDTWKFLDRRMSDLQTVGKGINQAQKNCSTLGDVIWGTYLVGRNVLGVGERTR